MAAKRAHLNWFQRRRALAVLVVVVLLAVSCTSTPVPRAGAATTPTPASPTPRPPLRADPAVTPQPGDPEPDHGLGLLVPRPTVDPFPAATAAQIQAALVIEQAPLGTYVVAKPSEGIPLAHPPTFDGQELLEIPVYDKPFGEPRVLTHRTEFDDKFARFPLLHRGQDGPPLVLRVIAGGPDDEWIKVQAPTLPHDRSVWVQSLYFDFGYTSTRIEIDLSGAGSLRLIDGGAIMIETPIAEGRSTAPTPRHVTYVMGGEGPVAGFGAARIALASYLGTWGTAGHDRARNYISGNEQPELLGQAITLGEVRVPSEVVLDLARDAAPGTPVIIFDSTFEETRSRTATIAAPIEPADTTSFFDPELLVSGNAVLDEAQLWGHCPEWQGSLCAVQVWAPPETLVPIGNVFLTAREGVGEPFRDFGNLIPVYDEPGGPKRHLLDSNSVDSLRLLFPLLHPNILGHPLVLNVIQGAPGDEWVLVQAPIRPHRQSVWVRAEDFVWGETLNRIEVDLGRDGRVTLFENDEQVISSVSVYGRESRPTTLHDTYVEQKFEGARFSPAYGTYILTLASYSEALGTYGGGGMPGQSLHGTNQPELVGQRVSSGGIRVPNDVIEVIHDQRNIVGAGVIIYDSTGIGREAAIRLQRLQTWFPARTTSFVTNMNAVVATSYS